MYYFVVDVRFCPCLHHAIIWRSHLLSLRPPQIQGSFWLCYAVKIIYIFLCCLRSKKMVGRLDKYSQSEFPLKEFITN